jgi:putative endonuclease
LSDWLEATRDAFARLGATHARGRAAEEVARLWLEGQGYAVEEINVRTAAGEIDVVARDGETLCFIEVKARATDEFGPAISAVTAAKQRRLARAAACFLTDRRGATAVRFDVLGLDLVGGEWRYTLVRDAFRADGVGVW